MSYDITWKCHVCGRERLDAFIEVLQRDRSTEFNLQPGVLMENVRYCKDEPSCIAAAESTYLIPKKEEAQ